METLVTVSPPAQPIASRESAVEGPNRIGALDWTKGALILCMVAYHAINYSAFRPLAFRYLAFLPPSFIFITGFLIAQVYATRYDLHSWKPYARLAIRGLKLLLLFIALNVLHCIFLERNLVDGLWEFVDRSDGIFLSGNGRTGIFEVLLPIAYFLLLAPGLLWVRSRAGAAIPVTTLAIFLFTDFLEIKGVSSKNLALLSAGFIGLAFGVIPIQKLDRFAHCWISALSVYIVYRSCSVYWGEQYAVQMFGGVATLLLLYCCAQSLGAMSRTGPVLVFLGRYSLLGYLAQIPLLQAVVKVIGGKPAHWPGVILAALSTGFLLFFVVRAADYARRANRGVDAVYRAIFA